MFTDGPAGPLSLWQVVAECRKVVLGGGGGPPSAATEWLGGLGADFILAIGDDWTDEDLFRALPPTAYSVRVGLANTAARYYLGNHTAVRRVELLPCHALGAHKYAALDLAPPPLERPRPERVAAAAAAVTRRAPGVECLVTHGLE